MAEIERYSFEPMRDSSQSEEDDVHGSQDERRRGNTSRCNASVVRTGKLQRNAYPARKSRKQLIKVQVNNRLLTILNKLLLYSAADVNSFSTRKLINRHRLGEKKTVV